MYAAVVCPRCRRGFAVDLEHRTSSCPHCGRQVQTRRMKTHFTSSTASETALAVAELNRRGRELKGFGADIRERDRVPPMTPARIEVLVQELGDFSLEDLKEALKGRTGLEAEELLRRMMAMGLVFEASPGRYRKT